MRQLASFTLDNGIGIHIHVLNTRKISIKPVSAQYEVLDENKKLIGLDYNGEYAIKEGTVLTIGKAKYKISEIRKSSDPTTGYELYTFRRVTTTGNLILPLLGQNRNYWRWPLEFTNAFIGDEVSHDGTEVSLLYRFAGTLNYADFESTIESRQDFIKRVDPDKFHTLYSFKLDDKYIDDVKLIMAGKYSQISDRAKARILEFHNSDINKPIGQVLSRCEKRRQKIEEDIGEKLPESAELLDMFNLDQEIYQSKFIIPDADEYRTDSKRSFI